MLWSIFSKFQYFDRSWKWKEVRKNHLKQQPVCQACGKIEDLEVHHIEPVHINPNRELDPSNLITLCSKNCHFIFGHLMDYKSWNPDVIQDSNNYFHKLKNRPYNENKNT